MSNRRVEKDFAIFDFSDFASYFSHYVKWRRKQNRSVSFRMLARQMGIKSASLLPMIARGERLPTEQVLVKIATLAELSNTELEYARALVNFQKSKSAADKKVFADKLRALKPNNADIMLEMDSLDLFWDWYNACVLEMVHLKGFRGTPKWISRRLGGLISEEQAKDSLDLLVRLGLLQRDEDGNIMKVARGFTSPRSIPSEVIRRHHKNMFGKAEEAIDAQPVDQRYFTGTTIAINKDKVKAASDLIVEFRDRIKNLIKTDEGDEIYHFAVQFFQVTKTPGTKRD